MDEYINEMQEWYNNTIGRFSMYQLKIAIHVLGCVGLVFLIVFIVKRIKRKFRNKEE